MLYSFTDSQAGRLRDLLATNPSESSDAPSRYTTRRTELLRVGSPDKGNLWAGTIVRYDGTARKLLAPEVWIWSPDASAVTGAYVLGVQGGSGDDGIPVFLMATYCCTTDPPVCPDDGTCRFAIGVLNSNGVTDDNFELRLNGTLIASIPETITDPSIFTCRGTLILPSSVSGLTPPTIVSDGGCSGADYVLVYDYSTLLDNFTLVTNIAELRSVHDNGQGNFGEFKVYSVTVSGGVISLCEILADTYDMTALSNNVYTFDVPCVTTGGPTVGGTAGVSHSP